MAFGQARSVVGGRFAPDDRRAPHCRLARWLRATSTMISCETTDCSQGAFTYGDLPPELLSWFFHRRACTRCGGFGGSRLRALRTHVKTSHHAE
jgi:excinuclease UvrABC ATPase subunit